MTEDLTGKLRPRPNALDSGDVERESEALWNVICGADTPEELVADEGGLADFVCYITQAYRDHEEVAIIIRLLVSLSNYLEAAVKEIKEQANDE